MARSLIQSGHLYQVQTAPTFSHPAYMVFPREADGEVLRKSVEGLRELARMETAAAG
jgi:hypothetical protein